MQRDGGGQSTLPPDHALHPQWPQQHPRWLEQHPHWLAQHRQWLEWHPHVLKHCSQELPGQGSWQGPVEAQLLPLLLMARSLSI